MDLLWQSLGIILMLAGLAGCIVPFLPGPPLCYGGLLLQQLQDDPPFTTTFLWSWAGITIAVVILEYVVPIYGAKKFGGTRYGVWGCTLGLIVGFFTGPWGIIIGPFIGAFIGELLAHSDAKRALLAAWGSFLGFLLGTLIKLVACVVMLWYFIMYSFPWH